MSQFGSYWRKGSGGGSNCRSGSSRRKNGGFYRRGIDHSSGVNQNMILYPQKLSCWNCKLKHPLTAKCPFKYCIFCWYQLIPGTVHNCDREWVKNLSNCKSQGDYRRIFHQGIEANWSWEELHQMFLEMKHDVDVPSGKNDAACPPTTTQQDPVASNAFAVDVLSDENDAACPPTTTQQDPVASNAPAVDVLSGENDAGFPPTTTQQDPVASNAPAVDVLSGKNDAACPPTTTQQDPVASNAPAVDVLFDENDAACPPTTTLL